jgi:hypothetical protein
MGEEGVGGGEEKNGVEVMIMLRVDGCMIVITKVNNVNRFLIDFLTALMARYSNFYGYSGLKIRAEYIFSSIIL